MGLGQPPGYMSGALHAMGNGRMMYGNGGMMGGMTGGMHDSGGGLGGMMGQDWKQPVGGMMGGAGQQHQQ